MSSVQLAPAAKLRGKLAPQEPVPAKEKSAEEGVMEANVKVLLPALLTVTVWTVLEVPTI